MATSVTFEQENLTSPIKLSFRTIQRVPIERGTQISNISSSNPMVLWHDYLIGSFARLGPETHGLFLWSMRENSIFYFEVCHSSFLLPGALNLNSGQTEFDPRCTKLLDDLLFISLDIFDGTRQNTTYHCIHIPSLVTSTQLPGGSLSLMASAFAVLLPECMMQLHAAWSPFSVYPNIYPIPACPPTHPRYCFINKRFTGTPQRMEWEVLEVEIDLSIPGPIKIFSRVSRQYTVQHPTILSHESDDDLLIYLPLRRGDLPHASLSVQFLRVGTPGKERLARLGGVDKMRFTGLIVDRDAGYVIIWVADGGTRDRSFIWWLGEGKSSNMVYSRTIELISSWSRGLLWRFW